MPSFFERKPKGPTPEGIARAIETGIVESSEQDPDAAIKRVPEAEALKALKTGKPWDPEEDNAALAEVEAAKRTLFYRQCVEGNLDLSQKHRDLIAKAMSVRKTASWAAYDGSDVKLESITVEGDLIIVKIDFYDGMNVAKEKIQIE